jgi:ribosomal protein L11 methyltransferase
MWQLLLDADKAEAERIATLWGEAEEPMADATSFFESKTPGVWRAEALYQDEPDAKAGQNLLDEGIRARSTLVCLKEQDWVAISLAGLPPVRAGGFVIHGEHDTDAVKPGETPILIEAGQAFGTGHHATTQGCLEAIDQVLRTKTFSNALDIGCGTGVLAMGLAKRAGIPIIASDLDAPSVDVAKENAQLNGCPTIEFLTAGGTDHKTIQDAAPYDMVLANILMEPLINLAADIKAVTRPGGTVILSGLLTTQEDPVIAAYLAQGLELQSTLRREEWSTLILTT